MATIRAHHGRELAKVAATRTDEDGGTMRSLWVVTSDGRLLRRLTAMTSPTGRSYGGSNYKLAGTIAERVMRAIMPDPSRPWQYDRGRAAEFAAYIATRRGWTVES